MKIDLILVGLLLMFGIGIYIAISYTDFGNIPKAFHKQTETSRFLIEHMEHHQ